MLLLISLFTVTFLILGFVSAPGGNLNDPFFSYFSSMINLIRENWFVFLLLFLFLTFLFLRTLTFEKKHAFHKKSFFSGMHVLTAATLGLLIAFIVLFFVAIIQLNLLSITLNTNKDAIGIISSRKEIYNKLKSNNRPPEIIAIDQDPHKELLAIAAATTGTTNYYGAKLLQSIPSFLVVHLKKHDSGMILLDNTLIVSEINQLDIQTISPVVGHLLVKHNFPTRKIKAYPKVSIMDQRQYQVFRRVENVEKLSLIDQEIKNITDKISSVSASIKADKDILEESKNPKADKSVQNTNLTELAERLEKNEVMLNEYRYMEKFYITQKKLLQSLTIDASREQAAFIPQDAIKIVYKTNNPHAIADYFAILTHEYLHYASYVSQNKMLSDSFFEEGLTEYFARSAIKNDLNTSTNLGYPVQAKIIGEMTNLIPESEFAQIYFTKDQEGLERALDRVYGDGFYLENKITFETLHYASTPNRILFLANGIMKKIGGKPLTEKDLSSTYSKL